MHQVSKSKSKEMTSVKSSKEQQRAYDPHSGTFRNLDENTELSGEFDVQSSNGSSSGDSEDHKDTNKQPPTTTISDADKREKIRQQNEKKHQRQKERRAQELHEKCTSYLMIRKLDSLSKQLVAMGISSENATLSLMLNHGRLEESVNWLFEANEEEIQKSKNVVTGSSLKLDITEELSTVSDFVILYKFSKQEVERAVVSCEGNLQKAEEMLMCQKQSEKLAAPAVLVTTQANRAEVGTKTLEPRSKNLPLTKIQSPEKIWTPSVLSDKAAAATPSVGSTIEGKIFPPTEPVIMMQRLQNIHVKQKNPLMKTQSSDSYISYNTENLPAQQHNHSEPRPNRYVGPEKINAEPYYPQTTNYSHRSKMGVPGQTGRFEPVLSRSGPTLNNLPSSLGLFSGWGSSTVNSVNRVDWSGRNGMYSCDYNTIDWTSEWTNWSPKVNCAVRVQIPRSNSNNNSNYDNIGLKKETGDGSSVSGVPHEWTSPFAGSDLFSLPRQYVTSPSP